MDDRLQGKELDSLIRYKERRKKRIEQNTVQDLHNITNGNYSGYKWVAYFLKILRDQTPGQVKVEV